MKDKLKAGETFQEMLQRKLGAKRAYAQMEEFQVTAGVKSSPLKSSKKVPRSSEGDSSTEGESPTKRGGTEDVNKDAEMSEGNKSEPEECASPENIVEQDIQSSDISGTDDFNQGASNPLSKRLRMYKCERCNSQFMGLAMLRQHCKDVHGDQKYYKCHVCGKLFSHPSSRNIHLRLHSGEKPYRCNTCGKQFRVSSHLKDHVRVHTGERPYICDICHKGFKQSSDLKKHRRTHTLDKPYKCPICPSAFTRSHHCRGHINSVHKFFKCVTCSALFTSEEAFERHKELHPALFPEQSDSHSTSSGSLPPVQSNGLPEAPSSATKDVIEDEIELHENNIKLDVANQLLELHKITQHNTHRKTQSSGSETTSESGDEVNSQTTPSTQGLKASSTQASPTVLPIETTYQAMNAHLPSAGHMAKRSATPPMVNNNENGFHKKEIAEKRMKYSLSPRPNSHGAEYLKLPFQNVYYIDGKSTFPMQEKSKYGSVSPVRWSPSQPGANFFLHTAEVQQQAALIQSTGYEIHSTTNSFPHQQVQFAVMFDSISQRRISNFSKQSPRGENCQGGNSGRQTPQGNVPCHRVSVIQYHSSLQKHSHDANHKEQLRQERDASSLKSDAPPVFNSETKRLENKPHVIHQENQDLLQSRSPVSKDLMAGIPQGRVPYVPLNADSSITPQSQNTEHEEPIGKYSQALKEAKKTYELIKTRRQPMQIVSNTAVENKQFIFPQTKGQGSPGMFDRSQLTSVDMLKFFAREQIKQSDPDGDVKSPASAEEESETSEASESGDVSNNGQNYSDTTQQPSPSESLVLEQRGSPESSIHHCQVCKKTFSRSSLLKQHSVIHMGNKRFKFRCEVCSKMFRTRSHLRDHTRIHTGERPFKCHICQKAFKQSSDLKKHINLHTGANQFKCEECNMEFRRADALRKHKLGHKMGNMPCGHCGKNFLHISALRQHRAMHNVQPVKTNRAFHRCNYCFKTFTKAESYKIHMEEHTREQSIVLFDCKICSMKFFTQAEFTDHMNIHNGKRPYKCFVCEKEFCIAEHLQDHVRLHTDVTPRIKCEEGVGRLPRAEDLVRQSVIHA